MCKGGLGGRVLYECEHVEGCWSYACLIHHIQVWIYNDGQQLEHVSYLAVGCTLIVLVAAKGHLRSLEFQI